jgi:L-asparaginase
LIQNSTKPICVLELGGTINCLGDNSTSEFYKPSFENINGIIDTIREEIHVEIEVCPFLNVISHYLTIENLIQIARKIKMLLNSDRYSGLIVTMGTNALEDVAYFISLIIQSSYPIVFTGAQYPKNSLSFDGQKNLYNAIKIIISNEAKGLGVLVTFYDYVLSARDAAKFPAGLPNNFSSQGGGVVGYIVGGTFVLRYKPVYKNNHFQSINVNDLTKLPYVMVVYGYIGMNDKMIHFVIETGVDGIVSAGFGKGYQPPLITNCLKSAVERGIPVIRCSRSGSGYSNRDSGYDETNGFIVSSGLSPHKAAILLSIALHMTKDINELKEIFMDY